MDQKNLNNLKFGQNDLKLEAGDLKCQDDCGLLFETMADISILNGNPFAWYVNLT